MILYEPSATADYRDYGIMLPIEPDRGKHVLDFLKASDTRDDFPVFDFSGAIKYLMPESELLSCKHANEDASADKYLLNRDDLERVHSKDFISSLYGGGINGALLNTFELIDTQGRPNRYEPDRAVKPLSDLFRILLAQAGGTYLACLLALRRGAPLTANGGALNRSGFCFYLGGGMHHARYDAPSGFCLINDIAAAALKITAEKNLSLVWIIDMDAHKGDGTAELVQFARNRGRLKNPCGKSSLKTEEGNHHAKSNSEKPCVLTLSIHMAKGWPLDAENLMSAAEGRAPLIPSDADIGIEAGGESCYTARLADGIRRLEKLSGKKADFVIVVDGADPYEHDGLASSSLLRLTLEQCAERDLYVYRYLQEREIPSAWIQSGGYGGRAWEPAAYFLKSVIDNA